MTDWSKTSATDFKSNDEWWNDSQSLYDYLEEWGEIPEGYQPTYPPQAFHGFFTDQFVETTDSTLKQMEFDRLARDAWRDFRDEEKDWDWVKEYKNLEELSVKKCQSKSADYLKIQSPAVAEMVVEFLLSKKKEMMDAKIAELQPKKKPVKNKVGSKKVKRDDSEYEIRWTNDAESAQGKDYPHYLRYGETTDENATTFKDGKITTGADGSLKKTRTWKAVRKAEPFLTGDNHCVGANTWDRAGGSEVLNELGIKGSFKMACLEPKADGSVFCKKCQLKNKQNIYCDAYKSGKVKGMTYAQVLWECSESGVEKEVVQERVDSHGGKWIE